MFNIPVYGEITQLVPSPNGVFLAVVTRNTIHIVILPDSSHLSGGDSSPLKLRTFQLGPTTHVDPAEPVISALWHPLGIYSKDKGCIVSVTSDAIVRVWELNRKDHWSFEKPTLAVDLKKLIDGRSLDQDFAPAEFGGNSGFSANDTDMVVANVCFGGIGFQEEDAWSPMTLWVATRVGGIFALCPLLPTRWQVPEATLSSLKASIMADYQAIKDEHDALDTGEEELAIQQRFEWLMEVLRQEAKPAADEVNYASGVEIRSRPSLPSALPKLQGPFILPLDDNSEDDLGVTDILVIAAKSDFHYLMGTTPSGFKEEEGEGMPATVIALACENSKVHICLDVSGVGGRWLPYLPPKSSLGYTAADEQELLLVESMDISTEEPPVTPCWPTFTKDLVHSRYDFFVTGADNVFSFSLSAWAERLSGEYRAPDSSGIPFRLDVLLEGSAAVCHEIFEQDNLMQPGVSVENENAGPTIQSASAVMFSFDVGYLLLTTTPSGAQSALLTSPLVSETLQPGILDSASGTGGGGGATAATTSVGRAPQRAAYEPALIFYERVNLMSSVENSINAKYKASLNEAITFGPETLDIMTAAHRYVSSFTLALDKAALALYQRCQRLSSEIAELLRRLLEISQRTSAIRSARDGAGGGGDGDGSRGGDGDGEVDGEEEEEENDLGLQARVKAVNEKQASLRERYAAIRKKIQNAGGRPLNMAEKKWADDLDGMAQVFGAALDGGDEKASLVGAAAASGGGGDGDGDEKGTEVSKTLTSRIQRVCGEYKKKKKSTSVCRHDF